MQIGQAAMKVVSGDLVQMDVDAIVNAANEGLQAGGGVCGAIFRAAGLVEMQRACDAVAPCPTGEARITPGFRLPARYVIHAVGPVWHGGSSNEAVLLASAYRSSLELAQQHSLASIAFPAISTGIFGYPIDLATELAVLTTADVLRGDPGSLRQVVFAVRDERAKAAYDRVLALVVEGQASPPGRAPGGA